MAEENKISEDSFALLYPDVSRDELLKNEEFNLFAGGRLGSEELSTVYKGYLDITERIRKREMERRLRFLQKEYHPSVRSTAPTLPKIHITQGSRLSL